MARIALLRRTLLACACLAGCVAAPPAPPPALSVTGLGHLHRVALQGAVTAAPRVHVYLEGDGRPFVTRQQVAADPTPRRRYARELMALDTAPALYLARPCYEGAVTEAACTPVLWTDARYGERVVMSMASALTRLRDEHRIGRLTLIGYSGGGVLAMLLAERVPGVDRVLTVAANLNVAAWAEHHRYSPLTASLDPARRAPLPLGIAQWHFAGAADTVVPPALVRDEGARQRAARAEILPGIGHVEGWLAHWPTLLAELAQAEATAAKGGAPER